MDTLHVQIVNLTPHAINIKRQDGSFLVVPPSGQLARCAENRAVVESPIEGVVVTVPTYGDVEGLPDPQDGTVYIVSALVLSRVQDRTDVFAPGALIRDADGKPVGCDGLSGTAAMVR